MITKLTQDRSNAKVKWKRETLCPGSAEFESQLCYLVTLQACANNLIWYIGFYSINEDFKISTTDSQGLMR